ncbi:MAG: hypothetical protein V9G19_20360 [Tetrasphaera sp.]
MTSRPEADERAAAGLPFATELLADYAAVHPQPSTVTEELDWFLALCHYKVVSTVAVLSKRNRRQPNPDHRMQVAEASLSTVIERAHRILDEPGRIELNRSGS